MNSVGKEDEVSSLRKCSSCKEFGYCGVECQRLDWKEHKHLCKFASPYKTAVNAGKNRLTRSKAIELGLVEHDEKSSSEAASGRLRTVELLKGMSTYTTPLIFLVLVIAGQFLGIFDELWRWVTGLDSS